MTVEEMDNMFEVLYNNITSNQAPGLNAYEKSVFLTKAQDEIVKNYFNSKSKGNNTQDGFDANQKRQVDYSMLTTVVTYPNDYTKKTENSDSSTTESATKTQETQDIIPVRPPNGDVVSETIFDAPLFDTRDNSLSVKLPSNLMMAINEMVKVTRGTTENVILQIIPLKFDEYTRLMSKPFKRPLKYQAWRLINSSIKNKADLIVGPSDTITSYTLRYIRRPKPIIVSDLDDLTIDGITEKQECELDPILHDEILQRAVELAKAAWTSTGQDNIQAVMQTGQRSE